MKNRMTLTAAAMLLLAGCATVKPDGADLQVQSSKDVFISNVHVDEAGAEVTVHGSLVPRIPVTTRVGHVDVEFVDEDGNVLKAVQADTNTNLFSRNSAHRPTFSATAEVEDFSAIRLTHHPDTLQQCDL
ncbi:hypothetical protein [Pontiella sp.]|uniref:hypothetical protein n=1 Tax=Pontiella sp. TaxID=2837462 RepID=UPI0035638276